MTQQETLLSSIPDFARINPSMRSQYTAYVAQGGTERFSEWFDMRELPDYSDDGRNSSYDTEPAWESPVRER